MLRTRIAPTPSGFLHLGNALSFITTWLWARASKGQIALRIDDLDGPRTQEAFVDDIFEQLHWMGLDWDEGPFNRAELEKNHSQSLRLPRYREALSALLNTSDRRVFSCECSRSELAAQGASSLRVCVRFG
jgi:glutamyl-tRNA synthetase